MDDSTRKKITRNLTYIKESICDDLDTFVDGLIEQDIFDIDIKEKLNSAETAKGKSDILICKILNKGPTAISTFIDLLRKKKYAHVLRKMDEVETEGVGASGGSVLDSLDQILIVKGLTGKEGAGGEPIIRNCRGNIPTQALEATEKSQYECLLDKYTCLQKAYEGLRGQLVQKQDLLSKMNRDKVAISKELKEVKHENQSLHAENMNLKKEEVTLKSEIQELERHLQQKKSEISDIKEKINNMEEVLSEERESRKRMEKKVDIQGEMLIKILQKIEMKIDSAQDPAKTNIQETARTSNIQEPETTPRKRQTQSKESQKCHVNKTNSSAKKK